MKDNVEIEKALPEVPKITEEQLVKARKTGRYEPIVFEQYKFVAQLVALTSGIDKNSPCFRKVPLKQYHVLVGLMNRCARLILGTMELSHKGKFGETTSIIFRCIFESAVKIIWLCKDSTPEKFELYINSGLDPEMELLDTINENVKKRGGSPNSLEERMIKSVARHIQKGETSEKAVRESKPMPDMASLLRDIGFDRIMYLSNHRIGSHHVHGTWPSLLLSYLKEVDGELVPRGNDIPTNVNEYIAASLILLGSIGAYCDFFLEPPANDILGKLCDLEEQDLLSIYEDMTNHGW